MKNRELAAAALDAVPGAITPGARPQVFEQVLLALNAAVESRENEDIASMPMIAEKIGLGVAISDKELAIAFRFYRTLADMLWALGPEFHLAHRPVMERLTLMETFKAKRKRFAVV